MKGQPSIQLKEIDRNNYEDCIALKVSDAQTGFVASNLISLVQAAYEPDMYPLAVYAETVMVGFILYDFDREIGGWSMSRYMIDEAYQNKKIGRRALRQFLLYFAARYGCLPLYTSVAIHNLAAQSLYEKQGFERLDRFTYEINGTSFEEYRMLLSPVQYPKNLFT